MNKWVLAVFDRLWARSLIYTAWAVVCIAGLAVIKDFVASLDTNVPPVKGSLSYEAAAASKHYFSKEMASGAILMDMKESSGEEKFMEFVNRSTCELRGNVSREAQGEGYKLEFSCQDGSRALGGGCLVKRDVGPQVLNATGDVLRKQLKLPAAAVRLVLQGINATLLPQFLSQMPDALCPVTKNLDLTKQLLEFPLQLQESLLEKMDHRCDTKVLSFNSVPTLAVNRSFKLPGVGPLNFSAQLPAGSLWSLLQSQLLSGDGRASLVATVTKKCDGQAVPQMGKVAQELSKATDEACAEVQPELDVRLRASSQASMLKAIQEGINTTMDLSTKTMPIALLILACMVGNSRLIICTLVNLVACILSSILFAYPLAKHVTLSTTAPSLMIAVSLAMSIDYSLFLLSRFQKEVAAGRAASDAVAVMLSTSGKIVLISGLTLLLCFLVMFVLPVPFIATLGVSAAITVFTAVAAALTLTPAMLMSFPTFFGSSRRWGCSSDGCCCRRRRQEDAETALAAAAGAMGRQRSSEEVDEQQAAELDRQVQKSCWPRFGRVLQKLALPTLAVLLAIGIPVAVFSLPEMSQSAGLMPFMPTNAPVTQTLLVLQDDFGVGALFPTTLLVVPTGVDMTVATVRDQWMLETCNALKAMAVEVNTDPSVPPFTAKAFTGKMILNGECTTRGLGEWSTVDGPYSATSIQINYQIDPFSADGQRWITRMRDAMARHEDQGRWYMPGEGPAQMDAAAIVFSKFPLMLSLMMAVVLVLIGLSFGSVIAPIRAVLCLSWMLAVTFGLAIFVFQDGCLDWMNWSQLGPRTSGAMSWMSPCISCSVIVGLGLDYDIFYSESVLEECEHGFGEREAAIRALVATANTISAAGLIMVIAFASLLLSTTPTLNEIAFLLIVGVLIDCFVTTKLIIPSVISLLGRANFWPRKFHQPCHTESVHANSVQDANGQPPFS